MCIVTNRRLGPSSGVSVIRTGSETQFVYLYALFPDHGAISMYNLPVILARPIIHKSSCNRLWEDYVMHAHFGLTPFFFWWKGQFQKGSLPFLPAAPNCRWHECSLQLPLAYHPWSWGGIGVFALGAVCLVQVTGYTVTYKCFPGTTLLCQHKYSLHRLGKTSLACCPWLQGLCGLWWDWTLCFGRASPVALLIHVFQERHSTMSVKLSGLEPHSNNGCQCMQALAFGKPLMIWKIPEVENGNIHR